jgi:hypothetical protein
MARTKTPLRGFDPAARRSLRASLAIVVALVSALTPAANARGGWHGGAHAEAGEQVHAGATGGGGRRHGNDSYMKAAAAERDKLLNSKLKSICRGC